VCQYANKPNGTACTSDGSGCTVDACQAGVCQHTPQLILSCRTPDVAQASRLKFRGTTPQRARLTWTWKKGEVALGDLGDPLTDGATDWELCLFDRGAPGGTPRFLASIRAPAGGTCAGKPCWRRKDFAFKYADKDRTPSGMATLRLRSSPPGAASLRAVAEGALLSLPSTALVPTVTVQVRRDDDPLTCWQGIYRDHILVNKAGTFTARSQ
jgi:hypothetical protein